VSEPKFQLGQRVRIKADHVPLPKNSYYEGVIVYADQEFDLYRISAPGSQVDRALFRKSELEAI